MGLKDIGATLPPGFKFNPSDEELVCHYLHKKITNDHEDMMKGGTLIEVDLHTCEPWQLPDTAKLNENDWYFFSFRDRKYATGYRTNRATTSGYWKATGKDRTVMHPATHEIVGMRKTLVFYRNRAPNGIKSGWIMHEFRLETPHMPPKEDWVLCRVFYKSKTEENTSSADPNCMLIDTTTLAACISLPSPLYHQKHTSLAISKSNLFPYTTTSTIQQDNSISKNMNTAACFTEISSKGGDDYGFLWDMGLDENNSFGDHHQEDHGIINASSNLEDMGFEVDNGLLFL